MKHDSTVNFIEAGVLSAPRFRKLLRMRNGVRVSLSLVVVAFHFFFVGGIAFYRGFFAKPLFEGATITVGIASAAGVIISFIVLELIYILISKYKLDPLQTKVIDETISNAK